MFVGVGNSLMASVYMAAGLMPSLVMRKPAKSSSRLANRNFAGLKTRPFLLQYERMMQILLKAHLIDVDQVITSSTICSKSFQSDVDGQFSKMASVYLL